MPISYSVHHGGHFIHAIAEIPVTRQEFVDYEVAHAIDGRIKPPVSELFEISADAFKHITMDDIREMLKRRSGVDRLLRPHRCAIALCSLDSHSWDLAKFYEGMVMLHSPETVIVFASVAVARKWIEFEDSQPNKPDAGDGNYCSVSEMHCIYSSLREKAQSDLSRSRSDPAVLPDGRQVA